MNKKIRLAFGAETNTGLSYSLEGKIIPGGKTYKDLGHIADLTEYEGEVKALLETYDLEKAGCDLHPDYLSGRIAEKTVNEKGGELVRIQHHFAHLLSVAAENGLEGRITGITFDGNGYGADGNIWGGEVFIFSCEGYERKSHIRYVRQPGGDSAAMEPWRMALSWLFEVYGEQFYDKCGRFILRIGESKIDGALELIQKEENSPLTSSAGRLFDAVSGITAICDYAEYQAQAPVMLENLAIDSESFYPLMPAENDIDLSEMITSIYEDYEKGISGGIIAGRFIRTLAEIVFQSALKIKAETGIDKTALSGGCFLNKKLVKAVMKRFTGSGMEVFMNKRLTPGDGNISYGQASYLSYL